MRTSHNPENEFKPFQDKYYPDLGRDRYYKYRMLLSHYEGEKELQAYDMEELVNYLEQYPQIDMLGIEDHPLGDEGGEILAKRLTKVRKLYLVNCKLGDATAKAIGCNPNFTHVYLDKNKITSVGAKFLAESKIIEELTIADNLIDEEGIEAFALNPRLKKPEYLYQSWHFIGDDELPEYSKKLFDLRKELLGKGISPESWPKIYQELKSKETSKPISAKIIGPPIETKKNDQNQKLSSGHSTTKINLFENPKHNSQTSSADVKLDADTQQNVASITQTIMVGRITKIKLHQLLKDKNIFDGQAELEKQSYDKAISYCNRERYYQFCKKMILEPVSEKHLKAKVSSGIQRQGKK